MVGTLPNNVLGLRFHKRCIFRTCRVVPDRKRVLHRDSAIPKNDQCNLFKLITIALGKNQAKKCNPVLVCVGAAGIIRESKCKLRTFGAVTGR